MSQSTTHERAFALLRKGTRRLHLASGEVWRLARLCGVSLVEVERESDGFLRRIAASDWVDDEKWGRPKTRPR